MNQKNKPIKQPAIATVSEEPEAALEKSIDATLEGIPAKKAEKKKTEYYGDRPENIRKPLSEMTSAEKRDYYLWKAGEYKTDAPSQAPVQYEEIDVRNIGAFVLPMIAARMPIKKPVSDDELDGFAKTFTPLANKYNLGMRYKEEFAAALFALVFIVGRVNLNPKNKKENPDANASDAGHRNARTGKDDARTASVIAI